MMLFYHLPSAFGDALRGTQPLAESFHFIFVLADVSQCGYCRGAWLSGAFRQDGPIRRRFATASAARRRASVRA